MAARVSWAAPRVQPATALPPPALRAVCRRAPAAGAVGARLHGDGPGALPRTPRQRRPRRNISARPTPRSGSRSRIGRTAAERVFLHHRRGLRRARAAQSSRAPEPAPGVDFVSGPDRAGAAQLVGAGGEPQLPPAACLDVRRAGALLHLPGAGDGGRGELPAGRRRRAGHARAHRAPRRCAARLPTAPAGRRFDRAAGAHRAAGLPGGGSPKRQQRAATSS